MQASVHITQPGNITGLEDFLRATAQAGKPISAVYVLNANLKDVVKRSSPTTRIVYRRQTETFNRLPKDFFTGEPVKSATNWMTLLKDKADQNRTLIQNWKLNSADYYDPLNEPVVQLPPNPTPAQMQDAIRKAKWLNTWMLTALEIAHANNMKLVLFSFPTGTPPIPIWPYLFEALRKGKQYGAILSLHEYSVHGTLQNPDPGNVLRYREVWKILPEDCRIPIMISECGAGNGYDTGLSGQAWVDDLMWYQSQTVNDSYLFAFNAFNLGGSESNMVSALPLYQKAIVGTQTVIPTPPAESVNGTFVPPADKIIDSHGHTWTLGATTVHGRVILRDGAQFAGGQGILLLYYLHNVYTRNDVGEWYVAGDATWTKVNDPRNAKKLAVPWVGQNTARTDDDYSNSDCGPTSECMWLRFRGVNVSVDDVSKATGLPVGYHYTTFYDISRAASKYGHSLKYMIGGFTASTVKAEVDANRPLIALVYYPALPQRYDPNYKQSHWIVITGYSDTGVFYNDPYWLDEQHGKDLFMTTSQFMTALAQVSLNGNTSYQGIVEQVTTPTAKAKSGVGMGVLSSVTSSEIEAMKIAKLETALLLTLPDYAEMRRTVQSIRGVLGNIDLVGRLFFPEDGKPYSPQQAIDYCRNGLQGMYDEGIREFQIGNEPNIYPGGMGWNWNNGAQFATWLDACLSLLRSQFSGAKWGYSALSPQPNTEQFFTDSKSVAEKCDFVGVHSYWQTWSGGPYNAIDESGGMSWKKVARLTSKPLYLTEYSCNTANASYANKGKMYKDYLALLRQDARIAKAYSFALSWGSQDVNNEAWVIGASRNQITDIPRNMV